MLVETAQVEGTAAPDTAASDDPEMELSFAATFDKTKPVHGTMEWREAQYGRASVASSERLDCVKFEEPVWIKEIRVIPSGYCPPVELMLPGSDFRFSITGESFPDSFKVTAASNNCGHESTAANFEKVGSLDYDVNSSVVIRPRESYHDNGATFLAFRGDYTKLTILVYSELPHVRRKRRAAAVAAARAKRDQHERSSKRRRTDNRQDAPATVSTRAKPMSERLGESASPSGPLSPRVGAYDEDPFSNGATPEDEAVAALRNLPDFLTPLSLRKQVFSVDPGSDLPAFQTSTQVLRQLMKGHHGYGHLVATRGTFEVPTTQRLQSETAHLYKRIEQWITHETTLKENETVLAPRRTEKMEACFRFLQSGLVDLSETRTDAAHKKKQEVVLSWITKSINSVSEVRRTVYSALNIRALKGGIAYAKEVWRSGIEFADRLTESGCQSQLVDLCVERELCSTMLARTLEAIEASLETTTGLRAFCCSVPSQFSRLQDSEVQSKNHTKRVSAALWRITRRTKLFLCCQTLQQLTQANVRSPAASRLGNESLAPVNSEISEALNQIAMSLSDAPKVWEDTDNFGPTMSRQATTSLRMHDNSSLFLQPFVYNTLTSCQTVQCLGAVVLGCTGIDDLERSVLTAITHIVVYLLRSRCGTSILANDLSATTVLVEALLQGVDPELEEIPSLQLCLATASLRNTSLRKLCTTVELGCLLRAHVQAFLIVNSLMCTNPTKTVPSPSSTLVHSLQSLLSLCTSYCGQHACTWMVLLLDATPWFIDVLKASVQIDGDSAESPAIEDDNRASLLPVSRRLVVKVLLYVMQDADCATVVEKHGVKLWNLKKKVVDADDSLSDAYDQLNVFATPCKYLQAKERDSAIHKMAQQILVSINQTADSPHDDVRLLPTLTILARMICHVLSYGDAVRTQFEGVHTVSLAVKVSISLLASVLEDNLGQRDFLPYVLIAAEPFSELANMCVKLSYDGLPVLEDGHELLLSLLRLYFTLWEIADPNFNRTVSSDSSSTPDLLRVRASVVLDRIISIYQGMICPDLREHHLNKGFNEVEYQVSVSCPALELLIAETSVSPSRFLPGLRLLRACMAPLEIAESEDDSVVAWQSKFLSTTIDTCAPRFGRLAPVITCCHAPAVVECWEILMGTVVFVRPVVVLETLKVLLRKISREVYDVENQRQLNDRVRTICEKWCPAVHRSEEADAAALRSHQISSISNWLKFTRRLADGSVLLAFMANFAGGNEVKPPIQVPFHFILRELGFYHEQLRDSILNLFSDTVTQQSLISADNELSESTALMIESILQSALEMAMISREHVRTLALCLKVVVLIFKAFKNVPRVATLFEGHANELWAPLCACFRTGSEVSTHNVSQQPKQRMWLLRGTILFIQLLCLRIETANEDSPHVYRWIRDVLRGDNLTVPFKAWCVEMDDNVAASIVQALLSGIQKSVEATSVHLVEGWESNVEVALSSLPDEEAESRDEQISHVPMTTDLRAIATEHGVVLHWLQDRKDSDKAKAVRAIALTGLKTRSKRFTNAVEAKGIAMRKVFRNQNHGAGKKSDFSRPEAMHVDDFQEADAVVTNKSKPKQPPRRLAEPARVGGSGRSVAYAYKPPSVGDYHSRPMLDNRYYSRPVMQRNVYSRAETDPRLDAWKSRNTGGYRATVASAYRRSAPYPYLPQHSSDGYPSYPYP